MNKMTVVIKKCYYSSNPKFILFYIYSSHVFQPGNYKNEDLLFRVNEENTTILPVVIHCLALDGESPKQSHTTIASIGKENKIRIL